MSLSLQSFAFPTQKSTITNFRLNHSASSRHINVFYKHFNRSSARPKSTTFTSSFRPVTGSASTFFFTKETQNIQCSSRDTNRTLPEYQPTVLFGWGRVNIVTKVDRIGFNSVFRFSPRLHNLVTSQFDTAIETTIRQVSLERHANNR
jgi:hypothetical protein